MSIQVIQDEKGKTSGVYIPIKQWKSLKKQYKELELLEDEDPTKAQILADLKEAFQEIKLIEEGKKKARPIQELLDEL